MGDKAALDAAIEASVSAAVALVNEAGARLQVRVVVRAGGNGNTEHCH